VGVDTAALPLIPTQDHQVELAIAFINQIPGISVRVPFGELFPVVAVADVFSHELLHILHTDVVVCKDGV